MERAFIDTNILVYYFGKEDSAKFKRSYDLITNPKLQLVTSTQVLSEFASVFLRKT
jgi:predicted nucleic acid-binding protein